METAITTGSPQDDRTEAGPGGNIFLTSAPKSGTHLVTAILQELFQTVPRPIDKRELHEILPINESIASGEPGNRVCFGHFRFQKTLYKLLKDHWKVVVLVRDPRDVVLSMRDFIATSRNPLHRSAYETIAELPLRDQIKAIIKGIRISGFAIAPIEVHMRGFNSWTKRGACLVRYEQFWSPQSLDQFAAFLGASQEQVERAIAGAFEAKTPTLNKGIVNRWRTEMDEELIAFFRANDEGCVKRLGYDWDLKPAAGTTWF